VVVTSTGVVVACWQAAPGGGFGLTGCGAL
jgi:hypothetical protein